MLELASVQDRQAECIGHGNMAREDTLLLGTEDCLTALDFPARSLAASLPRNWWVGLPEKQDLSQGKFHVAN